jgi:acyl carrier protein
MKEKIKEVVASILYLESPNEVDDNLSLFTQLGLTSIDYIDLCYELCQLTKADINLDNLWPINKIILDEALYKNSEWTDKGWDEVCSLLELNSTERKKSITELYDYFTVNYIEKRIGVLK